MQVGIVDIGSNTIVMNLYEISSEIKIVHHISTPVHLVQYIRDDIMLEEGIRRAEQTVAEYVSYFMQNNVTQFSSFITEPWRCIKNSSKLLNALSSTGIKVFPLSGKEEAEYDFIGSRADTGDILTGNAFDIGGGSTELIAFKDSAIVEAVSIPIGCVRLEKLPIDPSITDQYMKDAFNRNPLLASIPSRTIIGIGGTVRAAGLMSSRLYGTDKVLMLSNIEEIYNGLCNNDQRMINTMHEVINKGRWNVFLPGLNMLLSVCHAYHADVIHISEGCVREGFLYSQYIKKKD